MPGIHIYSDAAMEFASRHYPLDSERWYTVAFGFDAGQAAGRSVGYDEGQKDAALATAAPEPVRLTDPDDPRIRVGALVSYDTGKHPDGTWVTYRYNLQDGPAFKVGTVAYVQESVACGSWSLLAEAPEDPDADVLARIKDALTDLYESPDDEARAILRIARAES